MWSGLACQAGFVAEGCERLSPHSTRPCIFVTRILVQVAGRSLLCPDEKLQLEVTRGHGWRQELEERAQVLGGEETELRS